MIVTIGPEVVVDVDVVGRGAVVVEDDGRVVTAVVEVVTGRGVVLAAADVEVLDGDGVRVAPRDGLVGDVREGTGVEVVVPAGVSTAPAGAGSGSAEVAPAALDPESMNGNAARAVRPATQSRTRPGNGLAEERCRARSARCRSTSRTYAARVATAPAASSQSATTATVVPVVRSARSTSHAHQSRATPPTAATTPVNA